MNIKPICELNYKKDYELLIATVLSAQSTDKRVNLVTKELFSKYNIHSLVNANISDIENIIKPVGTYHNKSRYIIDIAKSLTKNYNGKVPNNREYLESLSGVGRKTCNVVLAEIFNENVIAVDTHVIRVSNRLGIVNDDNPINIEKALIKYFKNNLDKIHLKLVLFGRYICKSQKPLCSKCKLKDICVYKKKNF